MAGDFRDTLRFWHMARTFGDDPKLNADFIYGEPTTRIFPVQDGSDKIYAHIFHDIQAERLMPKYGTPTL